jgi:DNA-binding IclR family transcriptional regulator
MQDVVIPVSRMYAAPRVGGQAPGYCTVVGKVLLA